MKSRSLVRIAVGLVVVAGLASSVWRLRHLQAAGGLTVAPVRKGEFLVIVHCRGELKARRSVQLTAPVNVPDLQIVWLAPAGDAINAGQPVIRFDPSSARQQLQEKEAALRQAQATLDSGAGLFRLIRCAGKRAVTSVPMPNVLVTSSDPPCSSMIFFASGSPRPVPPCLRVRELST